MRPWLRRGLLSLLILLDGVWWLVACLSIVAGWWCGSAGLHILGVLALTVVVHLHFLLDMFPMRWLWPVTDALYDALVHRPTNRPGAC